MKSLWIVAQGGVNEPPTKISSTPVGQEQTKTLQPAKKDVNAPGQQQKTRGFDPMSLMSPRSAAGHYVFYPLQRPQKKRAGTPQMIQSLKKNDKVRTIGGIIGVIVDVKDDEITLKIDESNNTKIKVIPSAIGKNLSEEKGKIIKRDSINTCPPSVRRICQ